MATVLRMPGVSADASEAALVDWTVAPGDAVRTGDVIATIETEKAVVDIVADSAGTLFRTLAKAGDSVPIGDPIAVLLGPGEQDSDGAAAINGLGGESAVPASEPAPDAGGAPSSEGAASTHGSSNGNGSVAGSDRGRLFVTPLVRRLAAEAGMPLTELLGTGPNGRIVRRDLQAALAARTVAVPDPPVPVAPPVVPPPAAVSSAAVAPAAATTPVSGAAYTDVPLTRMRRAVAAALTASKQNVPHFYLKATCRVDALLDLRATLNADREAGQRVTINDIIVKAAAAAMRRVPEMNVAWAQDAVRHFTDVDVAVAMATERGLMTPVVRGVDRLSLTQVSATVKDLGSRAGSGTLKQHELEGGSLTISNLGMFGVEEFTAIINPPQVAILAVGGVVPRAVAGDDGEVVLARCLSVVLSVDHRPVDGAMAAQWLKHFTHLMEHPLQILA